MLDRYFKTVLIRRVFSLLALLEIGLAYVIYMNVYFIDQAAGLPILDMEIGYSAARVNEILGGYGVVERARYEIIMLADLIHPAVYASLLGGVIWRLSERKVLAAVPLFAALFDWAENAVIWQMVSNPLPVENGLAQFGNYLSLAKHGLLALTIVVLAWLLVRVVWRGILQ